MKNAHKDGDLRAAWKDIKNMASVNQPCETKPAISVNGVNDTVSRYFQCIFCTF